MHTAHDWVSDMAFPLLNMLSYWFFFISGALLLSALFTPLGAAAGGWTSYPTLALKFGSPGVGQTLWYMAIFTIGVSSILGAVNYITTIITLRAPGMGYFDMPLNLGYMDDRHFKRNFCSCFGCRLLTCNF